MSDTVIDAPEKRCTGPCGRMLPTTTEFFHRHKKEKDGLRTQCKKCVGVADKTYREAHREYHYARNKAYRKANPVRRPVGDKAYYEAHRERILARKKAYRKANRERKQAYQKAYYEANRERAYVYRHTRRARKKSVRGIHTSAQIQEQLQRQKRRCYYCSTKFQCVKGKYIYHVDHTFPLSRVAGTDIPANDISYLVLACPHCNNSKGDKFPWEFAEGGRLL